MDAATEPSKKRRRLEDDVYPSDELSRHREFFFDDGNIILQADLCTFCVHKSVLSADSEVFRETIKNAEHFYSPTSSTRQKGPAFVEGCPVIYFDGRWKDAEIMFSVLYNGCNRYIDFTQPLPFSTVSAMLSVGTKYSIETMRNEALKRLEVYFPAELKDFHSGVAMVPTDEYTGPSNAWPISDLQLKDAFKVIELASEYDASSLRAAAFYTAVQNPVLVLLKAGVLEATVRCLHGREELIRGSVEHLAEIQTFLKARRCKSGCRVDISRVTCTPDVLRGAASSVSDILPSLCKGCTKEVIRLWEDWRLKMWDSLMDVFDFE